MRSEKAVSACAPLNPMSSLLLANSQKNVAPPAPFLLPPGIGKPCRLWYTTPMVTEALLDSFPVSRYDTSVAEVLNEISEYGQLRADWDAEGALPISQEATRLASWLVQMVALTAKHEGVSWQPP